ncbi:MAG: OsmC family protein [Candidatus Sulfotelmatobacter sp.]
MSANPVIQPDAMCDGGDLDCGSGLLLIIRTAMTPLPPGGILEVRSREIGVKEDLPAWCRLVGHDLLATAAGEPPSTSYFIRKKMADAMFQQDLNQAQKHIWKARVRAAGGMEARVFVRNHSYTVGQPVSFDTADKAISAIEYLLGAMGACIAVGFQWRASQRGIAVNDLEVTLQARSKNILVYLGLENSGLEDSGHPGLENLEVVVYVDSDAEPAALDELLRDTVRRSPVTQTLERSMTIKVEARKA